LRYLAGIGYLKSEVRALAAATSEQLLQVRPVEANDYLAVYNGHRDSQLPREAHHLVRCCPVAGDVNLIEFDAALVKKSLDLMTVGSGLCDIKLDIHSSTPQFGFTPILIRGTNQVYDFCLSTRHKEALFATR
jgi:hypothetical protein